MWSCPAAITVAFGVYQLVIFCSRTLTQSRNYLFFTFASSQCCFLSSRGSWRSSTSPPMTSTDVRWSSRSVHVHSERRVFSGCLCIGAVCWQTDNSALLHCLLFVYAVSLHLKGVTVCRCSSFCHWTTAGPLLCLQAKLFLSVSKFQHIRSCFVKDTDRLCYVTINWFKLLSRHSSQGRSNIIVETWTHDPHRATVGLLTYIADLWISLETSKSWWLTFI